MPGLWTRASSIALIGVVLIGVVAWLYFSRDVIAVRINMPGSETKRVFVRVIGTYGEDRKHVTRELVRAYMPANQRLTFRVRSAPPWRFEGLTIETAHPGTMTRVQQYKANPHLWRVTIEENNSLLSRSPRTNSIAVSEIERHYDMISERFIRPIGLRAGAEEAWPHIEALRALYIAASFELEGQEGLSAELKRERLLSLAARWNALYQRLQSVRFLPCSQSGVQFMADQPGKAPGCGLKLVDQHIGH